MQPQGCDAGGGRQAAWTQHPAALKLGGPLPSPSYGPSMTSVATAAVSNGNSIAPSSNTAVAATEAPEPQAATRSNEDNNNSNSNKRNSWTGTSPPATSQIPPQNQLLTSGHGPTLVSRCDQPGCKKSYAGPNAVSNLKRHKVNVHRIPLSAQPRHTRWDRNPNRPKDEQERRERMLAAKRKYARKARARQKAAQNAAKAQLANAQSHVPMSVPQPVVHQMVPPNQPMPPLLPLHAPSQHTTYLHPRPHPGLMFYTPQVAPMPLPQSPFMVPPTARSASVPAMQVPLPTYSAHDHEVQASIIHRGSPTASNGPEPGNSLGLLGAPTDNWNPYLPHMAPPEALSASGNLNLGSAPGSCPDPLTYDLPGARNPAPPPTTSPISPQSSTGTATAANAHVSTPSPLPVQAPGAATQHVPNMPAPSTLDSSWSLDQEFNNLSNAPAFPHWAHPGSLPPQVTENNLMWPSSVVSDDSWNDESLGTSSAAETHLTVPSSRDASPWQSPNAPLKSEDPNNWWNTMPGVIPVGTLPSVAPATMDPAHDGPGSPWSAWLPSFHTEPPTSLVAPPVSDLSPAGSA